MPSTFSRTVDRMVEGGWLERHESPESRREVLVDLTAQGRALVDHVTERRRRQVAAVLISLAPENQQRIVEVLELFSTAAGEPTPEDLLTLGL